MSLRPAGGSHVRDLQLLARAGFGILSGALRFSLLEQGGVERLALTQAANSTLRFVLAQARGGEESRERSFTHPMSIRKER